jgi:homoserine O-acetyltransferase
LKLAILTIAASLLSASFCRAQESLAQAPDLFRVQVETNKGPMTWEFHRDWAPHGVARFYELVRSGYFDGNRFFRVIAGRWAQFGINGDPKIANEWRTKNIADDPRVESNIRGTIAYAFAVPNGRTTQLFINLGDNRPTHDSEPFVPIGRVIEGMNVADAFYSGYGEKSGSGIRAGKQGPLFEGGNTYLNANFPLLDWIDHATIMDGQAANSNRASSSRHASLPKKASK